MSRGKVPGSYQNRNVRAASASRQESKGFVSNGAAARDLKQKIGMTLGGAKMTQLKGMLDLANSNPQLEYRKQGNRPNPQTRQTPVVQRQIKISHNSTIKKDGAETKAKNYLSLMTNLDKIAKSRNWKSDKKKKIKAELVSMVKDDFVYDASQPIPDGSGGNPKRGFIGAINLALSRAYSGAEVKIDNSKIGDDVDMVKKDYPKDKLTDEQQSEWNDPNLDLIDEVGGGGMSPLREEMQDESDLYSEMQVPFTRRANYKNDQNSSDMDFTFGAYSGKMINSKGNFAVPRNGGAGKSYNGLLQEIGNAKGAITDSQYAGVLLLLMNGDKSGYKGWKSNLKNLTDELLGIIMNAEMSRGSIALPSFAATLHKVKKGDITLKAAFAGPNAVFLGANDGGATLLARKDPKDWSGDANKYKSQLEQQKIRASLALRAMYMDHNVPIKDIREHIKKHGRAQITNLISHNRQRRNSFKPKVSKVSKAPKAPKVSKIEKLIAKPAHAKAREKNSGKPLVPE